MVVWSSLLPIRKWPLLYSYECIEDIFINQLNELFNRITFCRWL